MPSRRRSTPVSAPRRSTAGSNGRSRRPTPSPSPFPSPPPPPPRKQRPETPPLVTFRAEPIDHLFPRFLDGKGLTHHDSHVIVHISSPTALDELARVHGEIKRRRIDQQEERQRQRELQRELEKQSRHHPDPGPSDPSRGRHRAPVELFSAPSRPVAPSPERHPLAEMRALAARSPSPDQELLTFDKEDPALFAELAQFLGSEEAAQQSDGSDDDGEDTYEARRLKRLKQNEMLLAQLGLVGGKRALADSDDDGDTPDSQSATPSAAKGKSKAGARGRKSVVISEEVLQARAARRAELDTMYGKAKATLRVREDGTTCSLPPRGSFYEVAFVEPPLLRERIRAGFTYCEGLPNLPPQRTPDPEPTPEPVEVKVKAVQKSSKIPRGEGLEEEGTSCHQCRRKTPEAKMRCRHHEGDQVCPLFFCQNCITIRYGIPFDLDNRSFKCPRCSGYCNCSRCLIKAGYDDLVSGAKGFQRGTASLSNRLRDKDGKLIYKSVHEYIMSIKGTSVWGAGGLNATPKKREKKDSPAKGEGDAAGTDTTTPAEVPAKKSVKLKLKKGTQAAPAAVVEAENSTEQQPRRKIVVKLRKPSGRAEGEEVDASAEGRTQANLNGEARSAVAAQAQAQARSRPAHDESHVWVKNAAEVSDSEDEEDEDGYEDVEVDAEDAQAQEEGGEGFGAAPSRGRESEESESDLSSAPTDEEMEDATTFRSAAERAALARYGGLTNAHAQAIVDYATSDEEQEDSSSVEGGETDDEGDLMASGGLDDKLAFEEGGIEDSFEAGVVESVVPSFYDAATGIVSTAPLSSLQLAPAGLEGMELDGGEGAGSPGLRLTEAEVQHLAIDAAATEAALRSFSAGIGDGAGAMDVDNDDGHGAAKRGHDQANGGSAAHRDFASSNDGEATGPLSLDNVLASSSSGAEDIGPLPASPIAQGGTHMVASQYDDGGRRWDAPSSSISLSAFGTSSPAPSPQPFSHDGGDAHSMVVGPQDGHADVAARVDHANVDFGREMEGSQHHHYHQNHHRHQQRQQRQQHQPSHPHLYSHEGNEKRAYEVQQADDEEAATRQEQEVRQAMQSAAVAAFNAHATTSAFTSPSS